MTAPDGFFHITLAEGTTAEESGPVDGAANGGAVGRGGLVACSPAFADQVRILAARRATSPLAIVSAILLVTGGRLGEEDPGPGPAVLAARPPDADAALTRRALATALALADGERPLRDAGQLRRRIEALEYRNAALAAAIERVAFQPLAGELTSLRDALQIFGFVNEWCFDEDRVTRRFRELAPVYHPDTGVVGCRRRMAQLLEARALLIRHVRTAYIAGRRAGVG